VRDQLQIGRLEARRYAEHVRRDLVPLAAVVGLATVAAGCGLVALFLGIARALGSVAWAFVVFCALFTVAALAALAVARAPR
jgi:uncharacterized membrane protein